MLYDLRLKALAGILILGALAIGLFVAFDSLSAKSSFVFGDASSWENIYEDPYNNVSFRYPDDVEVITPHDVHETPVSIVLTGERGESMLIQSGTLRREDVYADLDEAISDYEERFLQSRDTRERISHEVDGRRGITLLQEETSGRFVGETFFYDLATVSISRTLGAPTNDYEIREISLQLPSRSGTKEQKLYTDLYLDILSTFSFLKEPKDNPDGFPSAWQLSEVPLGGFSLIHPPDWDVSETRERLGMQETVFSTKFGDRNDSYSEYSVAVMSGSTSASFLDSSFAQPFRDNAYPGTLEEETVELLGLGESISLEARQPKDDPIEGNEVQTLLLIVGGDDTPQAGRGYVIRGRLPEGAVQQSLRFDQIRAMTRSLKLR